MKKVGSIFSIIFFVANAVFGQTTAVKTALAPKEIMLCKVWKMISSEQFSVVSKPADAEKNDGITFTDDKKVSITREGKTEQGTWKTNKIQSYIYISIDNSTEKIFFKLISINDNELVYEYQDLDLIRTIYTFKPSEK